MRHRSLLVLATALCIATTVSAQSQTTPSTDTAQAPNQASSTASAAPPAGKKVWTNEDVSDLRTNSTISTVGSTDTKPSAKTSSAGKPKNPKQYPAQIARLEGQIPQLDQEIAELQVHTKSLPDARHYLRCQKRVSTQVKEVFVYADLLKMNYLCPDSRQGLFRFVLRLSSLHCAAYRVMQHLSVNFAVGSFWQIF